MKEVALTLIDVCFLEVVGKGFHVAVVDEQEDEDDSCDNCDAKCDDEDGIIPYLIVREFVNSVVLYGITADETEHVNEQLTVDNDINERDAGGWRQGFVDNWHQSHINDHKSGNITNFVVVIGPLHESKQCQNGDEDKRNEDGERVHDWILVKGNIEGDDLIGTVRICVIAKRFFSSEFFALDSQAGLSQIVFSQTAIICKHQLLEGPLLLFRRIVTHPLHAIELELHKLRGLFVRARQLHIDVFEDETEPKIEQIEGCNKVLEYSAWCQTD